MISPLLLLVWGVIFIFYFFFGGYCSLAEKVASVLGCVVIPMENYRSSGTDDGNDLDSIDFDALVRNLQVLIHLRRSLIN